MDIYANRYLESSNQSYQFKHLVSSKCTNECGLTLLTSQLFFLKYGCRVQASVAATSKVVYCDQLNTPTSHNLGDLWWTMLACQGLGGSLLPTRGHCQRVQQKHGVAPSLVEDQLCIKAHSKVGKIQPFRFSWDYTVIQHSLIYYFIL